MIATDDFEAPRSLQAYGRPRRRMDSPCFRCLEECEVCSEVFGSVFGEVFGILTRRSLFSFYMQKSWHGLSRGIEVQGKYECGCRGSLP